MKDYYGILELAPDASEDEIKKSYRDLARKYHPDLNPEDSAAEERFKDISEAYAVLSDSEKRKEFDTMRMYGARAEGGNFSGGQGFNVNLEDLFGPGGPESLFDQVFGGRGFRGRTGQSVESQVTIPFELSITGGSYEVRLPLPVTHSGGDIRQEVRNLHVSIPAGIQSGAKLRLKGKGYPGQGGGAAGDLLLLVNVARHAVLKRQGDNVLLRVPISIHEAHDGAEIDVPTVDGLATLKVHAGAKSGQKLRMRGKGVRRGVAGDQLVELLIYLPTGEQATSFPSIIEQIEPYNPRSEVP